MQNLSNEKCQNHACDNNKSRGFLIASKKHQKFLDKAAINAEIAKNDAEIKTITLIHPDLFDNR